MKSASPALSVSKSPSPAQSVGSPRGRKSLTNAASSAFPPSSLSKTPSPKRRSRSPATEQMSAVIANMPHGHVSGDIHSPSFSKTPSSSRKAASTPHERAVSSPAMASSLDTSLCSSGTPAASTAWSLSLADSVARTPHGRRSGSGAVKTPSPANCSLDTTQSKKTLRSTGKMHSAANVHHSTESLTGACKTNLSVELSAGYVTTPTPPRKTSTASSPSKSPTVRGRFSVSRISTPSPVADQKENVAESIVSEQLSSIVTPKVEPRRKSMRSTSKKSSSFRRKSAVLDAVRSRRSGASQANLKVTHSWADIVKHGAAKCQVGIPGKKRRVKGRTMKKVPAQTPKTPAQKIQHFSTGHADSPVTIVIGRAHTKTVQQAGCVPKLVQNTALMKKTMEMNENLTGIAEMFSTPVNDLPKQTGKSGACSSPLKEASVMTTPEETGEMVVSPLSPTSTIKRGRYNKDAVSRLLQQEKDCSLVSIETYHEKLSFCDASVQDLVTTPKERVEHVETLPLESGEKATRPKRTRTPSQKTEPLMPLTGVKRIMKTPKEKTKQVEDLRGLKRLLKTPRMPKSAVVEDLVGVKRLFKTPRQKSEPVEDIAGEQRMMKMPKVKGVPVDDLVCLKRSLGTPKQKGEPVEDMVAVKRLLRTPKQKGEPVEDMVAVKRLLRTPKLKGEPVEDMVGVKRLLRTPKQKGEPVEDMVGVKRLLRTPKQKGEPVEDMVGVKRLLRTPKQKGEPVEHDFGIRRLVKSPKQRSIPVEDFTGLPELMQEPLQNTGRDADFGRTGEPSKAKILEQVLSPKEGKTSGRLAKGGVETKEPPAKINCEELQEDRHTEISVPLSPKKLRRGRKPRQNLEAPNEKLAGSDIMENKAVLFSPKTSKRGRKITVDREVSVEDPSGKNPFVSKENKNAEKVDQHASGALRSESENVIEVEHTDASNLEDIQMSQVPGKRPCRRKITGKAETSDKKSRGRKPKQNVCHQTSEEASLENLSVDIMKTSELRTCEITNSADKATTTSSAPVKISTRGRKSNKSTEQTQKVGATSPSAIRREGTSTSAVEKASSPVPVRKSRRGGKAKQNLEDLEEIKLMHSEKSLAETLVTPPTLKRLGCNNTVDANEILVTASPAPVKRGRRGRKSKEILNQDFKSSGVENISKTETSTSTESLSEKTEVEMTGSTNKKSGRGRKAGGFVHDKDQTRTVMQSSKAKKTSNDIDKTETSASVKKLKTVAAQPSKEKAVSEVSSSAISSSSVCDSVDSAESSVPNMQNARGRKRRATTQTNKEALHNIAESTSHKNGSVQENLISDNKLESEGENKFQKDEMKRIYPKKNVSWNSILTETPSKGKSCRGRKPNTKLSTKIQPGEVEIASFSTDSFTASELTPDQADGNLDQKPSDKTSSERQVRASRRHMAKSDITNGNLDSVKKRGIKRKLTSEQVAKAITEESLSEASDMGVPPKKTRSRMTKSSISSIPVQTQEICAVPEKKGRVTKLSAQHNETMAKKNVKDQIVEEREAQPKEIKLKLAGKLKTPVGVGNPGDLPRITRGRRAAKADNAAVKECKTDVDVAESTIRGRRAGLQKKVENVKQAEAKTVRRTRRK
uniref:PP1-binding domain-containing protein n=1 Tax=Lepisosteus oculatus TaxID=7918 RepID=W5MLL1_LEPOC